MCTTPTISDVISVHQGTLLDTWKEVRPTSVFAVPRLWEKINERLVAEGSKRSAVAKKISAWARDKGLRGSKAEVNGYIITVILLKGVCQYHLDLNSQVYIFSNESSST